MLLYDIIYLEWTELDEGEKNKMRALRTRSTGGGKETGCSIGI